MTATAPPPVRRVEQIMGMPISLAVRGRHADDAPGRAAWQRVVTELHEVDRMFSRYRADSVVSRLSRGELRLDRCPPEVAEVLDLGMRAEVESGGAFRIRRAGPDGAVELDADGVVKGWAVQRAARFLAALPETDFCLSAGGDMVCSTTDPDAPPWRIGIEHPLDPTRLIATVPLANGAVATSGGAHRGEHVVDARTGRPPEGVASVTVIGTDLTWTDIDATAAYAHGRDAARWLAGRPGRTGLVVWRDGTTTTVG